MINWFLKGDKLIYNNKSVFEKVNKRIFVTCELTGNEFFLTLNNTDLRLYIGFLKD